MSLIVAYLVTLIVVQSVSVGAGLLVDRLYSSHAGLMVFIFMYFLMFWLAWQVAVRVTAPKDGATRA